MPTETLKHISADAASAGAGARGGTVPPPPHDAQLPCLASCLESDLVADEMRRHWTAAADVALEACRPEYIRYKPGTLFHVVYTLSATEPSGAKALPVVLTVYAGERGLDTWRRKSFVQLRLRGQGVAAGTPRGSAAWLPGLGAILQAYPLDRKLPWLLDAASPSVAAAAAPGAGAGALAATVRLVRYKPARKALLHVTGLTPGFHGRTATTAAYVKVHADGRGAAVLSLGAHLTAAGVATVTPTAYAPAHHLLWAPEAPGQPLRWHRGRDSYLHLMAPTARLLAQLHGVQGPPAVPSRTEYNDGLAAARGTAAYLGRLLPERRRQLDSLSAVLGGAMSDLPRRRCLVHGDFYDDQVMVDGALSLLDLDEAGIGHPLLDVGNFLAHLEAAGIAGEVPAPSEAASAFLEAYAKVDPAAARLAPMFTAAGLVRLAVGPFRRLESEWPERVGALVDAAAARAATAGRGARGFPTVATRLPTAAGAAPSDRRRAKAPGAPVDPALPHLDAILDPEAVTVLLRQAVDDPGLRVVSVALDRHKPGRRALVRLRLAAPMGPDPSLRLGLGATKVLYGKTFASDRGPRVFDIHRRVAAALDSAGPATPADPRCAPPIAHLEELRLLVQGSVPGRSFADSLGLGVPPLGRRTAEALWRFHHLVLDVGRAHGPEKELGALGPRVEEWLAGGVPVAAGQMAEGCLAAVTDGHPGLASWRYLPIHRDFYPDQLLVSRRHLFFLDLDDVAMSEPAIDVANFTAHLELMAHLRPETAQRFRRVAGSFLATYATLDPKLDLGLVRFLEGATLLRLATIHCRRPGGRRLVAPLVAAASADLTARRS